jgi:23S rRNA pseudouridine1911/1915/1917 synthase
MNARDYSVGESSGLLDFLLKTLTGMSRNSIKSLLSKGAVSVGGRTVTQFDTPLKAGMTVRIAAPGDDKRQAIIKRLKLIYEDDDLIAAVKPAGLLSIATEHQEEETAYHILTDYVRVGSPKSRIFVVHRLDRDTSGIMLVAKNERMKLALQDDWSTLVAARGYTAVAEGIFSEKSGRVTSWLKETKTHVVYSSGHAGDGQEAVTNYQVTKETSMPQGGNEYSLLSVTIETGRKNQIRVQLAGLGHPIAGDKKYGAKTDPLGRLCLHAGLLELRHPFTGELMRFETAVPGKFSTLF